MLQNLLDRAQKARKSDGGFTLIELLIVITVLGILAGIVVFGVSTFRNDANTAAKNADCKTVSVAAEAFNARTGGYPTVIGDLLPKTTPAGTTPGYLKAAPASGVGATFAADGTPSGC